MKHDNNFDPVVSKWQILTPIKMICVLWSRHVFLVIIYYFVPWATAPWNKCNMLITHCPDSAKGSFGRSPPSPASRESRPAWREWPQLQEPQDPVRGQTDPVPGPAPGGRGPQRECRQHARPYESTQSQVEHLQNTVIALFAILFLLHLRIYI